MWRTSSRDQKEEGAFVYFVQPFPSCFCCYMMMGLYFTHQINEESRVDRNEARKECPPWRSHHSHWALVDRLRRLKEFREGLV